LRFSTKVFLALAGLVCLTLAVALLVLEGQASRRVAERFAENFAYARTAFRELESLRLRYVADEIESLARANPQLRTVLSTASLAPDFDLGIGAPSSGADDAAVRDANLRLRSLLPSLALSDRSDVLVVLSAAGKLLYSRADPERAGDDLARLPLYRATVEHGGADGVWLAPEAGDGPRLVPEAPAPAVYRVVARPVVFESAVHGVVVAGERIDTETLASIRAVSGLHLALAAQGGLVATTLPDPARGELAALAPRLPSEGDAAARVELAGAGYLARRGEIAPGIDPQRAAFVLLGPLDAELAFLRRLRVSLLGSGAAILVAALLPAFALARGITRPVAVLVRAARRVGAGDLDTRVSIASSDEIGELGRAFDDMTRGLRERERILRTFERYVSKEVAEEVLRHPEVAPVGGARRELTVGFVDLAGFTALAERARPEELVARLGEYFEVVCDAVLATDGTVNEFIGDGVVAFWGAPVPHADHAARAARAALHCRDALAALVERWRGEGYATDFRIGLHTGELVVGEIGGAERRAYRAVGDVMNVASRIEGANKAYGTSLLASETTVARADGAVAAREIDRVHVVGRAEPLVLFELMAPQGELDPARAALAARYAEGLAAYRARDFAAALRHFAACLALAPEDGPSAALLARARGFLAAPPPPVWDGSFDLTAK
jgi:adenylate cyclase